MQGFSFSLKKVSIRPIIEWRFIARQSIMCWHTVELTMCRIFVHNFHRPPQPFYYFTYSSQTRCSVFYYSVSTNNPYYFIGLNDDNEEGNFVWTPGDIQVNYTNWGIGRPYRRLWSHSYNAVVFYWFNSKWYDVYNTNRRPHVCEIPTGMDKLNSYIYVTIFFSFPSAIHSDPHPGHFPPRSGHKTSHLGNFISLWSQLY